MIRTVIWITTRRAARRLAVWSGHWLKALSDYCYRIARKLNPDDGNLDESPEAYEQYLQRVNNAVLSIQFGIRSLVYHRAINRFASQDSKFWTHTSSELLRSFVIYWTDVLGSDSNPSHWKKLAQNVSAFRKRLLANAGMDRSTHRHCWRRMISLRNKVMAHDDPEDRPTSVPDLEPALRLLKALYEILREEATERAPTGHLPKFAILSVETWQQNLEEEAAELVEAAMKSTSDLQELY